MWNGHLLQLLHLEWEEGHAEGQRWASSSVSASKGLADAQPHQDSWKAALLGSLNTL